MHRHKIRKRFLEFAPQKVNFLFLFKILITSKPLGKIIQRMPQVAFLA